jgi:carbon-monoxide dehydrogenase medium subunit
MWERYFTPHSLERALELLTEHRGKSRIIAGATDLILEMERGQRPGITVLIDLTRIPGLNEITLDQDGWIHLGPLVTHNQCAGSSLLIERAFTLARACWEVGAPQIRNRATVVGNLVTASPANDSIPPLMALGAQLTLRSAKDERVVQLNDFFSGVRKTILADDELVADIAFPAPGQESQSTFIKLGLRRAQAISVVNVAVVVNLEGLVTKNAAITLGSVAPTVIRAVEAEKYLVGKTLEGDVIENAAQLAEQAASPIDDLRASAEYRSEMVRVCTVRALRSIAAGDERVDYPSAPVMLKSPNEDYKIAPLQTSIEHSTGIPIETTINGSQYSFESGHNKTLLNLLRDEAGLIGTKEGCAEGECGACTVFLDGAAVMSCMVPAPQAHGSEIVTIEGLMEEGKLHAVQEAFLDEGAVQCGYCTPGFLMSGAMLIEERHRLARNEIAQAFTGNLCRCTGYYKIVSALEKALVKDVVC